MKSPQKQHIHHFIFICLLMVVGWGQECDESEEFTDLNENGIYDIVEPFIDTIGNECFY